MSQVLKHPKSEVDLLEIWFHIAEDNPVAADSFLSLIDEKCVVLSENPYIGAPRFDLANNLRMHPVGDYLIFYQPAKDGIKVARIVHSSRDISPLMF